MGNWEFSPMKFTKNSFFLLSSLLLSNIFAIFYYFKDFFSLNLTLTIAGHQGNPLIFAQTISPLENGPLMLKSNIKWKKV